MGSTESTFFTKLSEFVKKEYTNCYFNKITLLWQTISSKRESSCLNRICNTIFKYCNQKRQWNMCPDQFKYGRKKYTALQVWPYYKIKKNMQFKISLFQKSKMFFLKITHRYNWKFTYALFIYIFYFIIHYISFFFLSYFIFLSSLANNPTFHFFLFLLIFSFIFFLSQPNTM